MDEQGRIAERSAPVAGILDERGRRAVAAAEALARGRGGIAAGARDPTVVADLERLVEPTARGDPASPLRWTSKSVRTLAAAPGEAGHQVSRRRVAEALRALGYSLQGNRTVREGAGPPDRDAQFAHVNAEAEATLAAGEPVIAVATKTKELVGDFRNGGREWRPKGGPEEVRGHDFVIPELGRVSPYRVYDLAANAGWVSAGIDHATAAFAVATIRRRWAGPGRARYPGATRLVITADGGGSNGSRVRLWKWELQRLADETGLAIGVCHLPPGTSKWTAIEHRLFSFITRNWRGTPLVGHAVILSPIAATTTATGLPVESYLDTDPSPAGQQVSDAQVATLRLGRDAFHGDWNYTIRPRAAASRQVIP